MGFDRRLRGGGVTSISYHSISFNANFQMPRIIINVSEYFDMPPNGIRAVFDFLKCHLMAFEYFKSHLILFENREMPPNGI